MSLTVERLVLDTADFLECGSSDFGWSECGPSLPQWSLLIVDIVIMAASGGVLVVLSGQSTPQPDGLNTIRCCCRVGCRRRCPVGRLRACMACSTSVGPCCGFLAIDDSLEAGCPLREFVVCHVCFFAPSRSHCMWSPSVADFPHMNIQQAGVWHQARREFVWQDALHSCGK